MKVNVSDIPLRTRCDTALRLIELGEDPALMLSVALWPEHAPVFDGVPTINLDGFCKNGHPWDAENTFIRKNGWRKCRSCEREQKRLRDSIRHRRVRRKVPCVYCGEPATAAHDKGTGGLDTPRCRACFRRHLREGRQS